MFISYDWLETKYNERVGRAVNPEGPFLNFNGSDMNADEDNIPMILAPHQIWVVPDGRELRILPYLAMVPAVLYGASGKNMRWSIGFTDKAILKRGRHWENKVDERLTFTGLDNGGTAIWGKKLEK